MDCLLDGSPFEEIVVTDTIRRIFTCDSVSEVFKGQNQVF